MLSHLLASYNIPREVTPTPRNALMIIKYILRKSDHSLNSLQHALQVLSTYCLLFRKRTRTTVSLTCVGNFHKIECKKRIIDSEIIRKVNHNVQADVEI